MKCEPFDEEWEEEVAVPSDVGADKNQTKPVQTVEDFKQRLVELTPDELAFLWARMRMGPPSSDP